eukprot:Phypoly_transcript_18708.p1 GENE.Phypoly_transcript_18708~~Phypoly_transcript_18708.p1  ORF type:complete len:237 (+),score=27.22 Phypoly_transcript_18708:51-713(+)
MASDAASRLLISQRLAAKITEISNTLYSTDVTPKDMEPLHHYFSKDIFFKDPWQQGGGIDKYTAGMNAFHSMLNFDFTDFQAAVTLEEKKRGKNYIEGRAMIDGVMHLRQFSWIYTYPLRTILVYKLRVFLDESGNIQVSKKDDINFQIYFHEEMWSFGGIQYFHMLQRSFDFADMIQNLPSFLSIPYSIFRTTFAYGFLAVGKVAQSYQTLVRGPAWSS